MGERDYATLSGRDEALGFAELDKAVTVNHAPSGAGELVL
jgi:hypothetical protein